MPDTLAVPRTGSKERAKAKAKAMLKEVSTKRRVSATLAKQRLSSENMQKRLFRHAFGHVGKAFSQLLPGFYHGFTFCCKACSWHALGMDLVVNGCGAEVQGGSGLGG